MWVRPTNETIEYIVKPIEKSKNIKSDIVDHLASGDIPHRRMRHAKRAVDPLNTRFGRQE